MSHGANEVEIAWLLAGLGYRSPAAHQRARAAIQDAGLTSSSKKRIAASKVPAVQQLLSASFVIVCAQPGCHAAVRPGDTRVVLAADQPADCSICSGQPNRAALDRAIEAFAERGLRRVVVVGGSPATRAELDSLSRDRLDLRLVSGTDRRTARDAKADLAWAHLIVVWGSTELDHKVSKLYTDSRDARVVTCPRRGIAALAGTLLEAARRR